MKNQKPISLLCVSSKILEAIVNKTILDFLSPLISSQQFGFMKNRSCLKQLLIFLSDIYHSVDHADVIYFDFKRPLIQCLIISCFWSCGSLELQVPYECGLRSFFNIMFTLMVPHLAYCQSTQESPTQGSILGLLLFLACIWMIFQLSCSTASIFEDDTEFVKRIFSEDNMVELQTWHKLSSSLVWEMANVSACILTNVLRFVIWSLHPCRVFLNIP